MPVVVSDETSFTSVSTHLDHTCGIAESGFAYCWGFDTFGQLGVNNDSLLERCVTGFGDVLCSTRPLPVAGGLVFTQLDVGFAHTCGVTIDLAAYCWGANTSGQIGVATDTLCFFDFAIQGSPCALAPVRIEGVPPFRMVSAGRMHTCALTDQDEAYCWGTGESGRLGIGLTEGSPTPTKVLGGYRFREIDAGGGHTCALTFEDEAVCWGSNADMQLATPFTDLACGNQLFKCFAEPIVLPTTLRFATISVSGGVGVGGDGPPVGGHTCGLVSDGNVYCWGLNTRGQLVNHSDLRSSKPIKINDEKRFVQIDVGFENTCGIDDEQNIVCWAFGGPATRFFTFPS